MKRQKKETSIQSSSNTNTDELKKYKDLLDSGIITQEEFDAKKKPFVVDSTSSKSDKEQKRDYNKANRQERKAAGAEAASKRRAEVRENQKRDYRSHGGVFGSVGRVMAHYTGADLNLKQTLMQGRQYNT